MIGDTWTNLPVEIDPPHHAKYRAFINPLFTPVAMTKLEGKIRQYAIEDVYKRQGIGTTSNVLAGALWLLARHPAQKQLLISNPALLDSAIEECLRYHSSGLVAFVRFATCDTDVGGTRILKDMPVYVSPQAAGFDPGEVEDPFRFDITRTRRTPLVFGGGIHHCIGQRLARHILRCV